jgi:hypothetical protein
MSDRRFYVTVGAALFAFIVVMGFIQELIS